MYGIGCITRHGCIYKEVKITNAVFDPGGYTNSLALALAGVVVGFFKSNLNIII